MNNNNNNNNNVNGNNEEKGTSNNYLGMAIVGIMVCSSAGFTMYTKRTSTMLKQMDQIAKNQARRMPPTKEGPKTKLEWERTRNRWEKDDL